jgi:hypothetical protein
MKILNIFTLLLFCITNTFAQNESDIKWMKPINSKYNVISGQAWPKEVESSYHRLPKRAKNKLRKAVWNLSKQSAGLSIRFNTNANIIHVRYKLKGGISMPHMPAKQTMVNCNVAGAHFQSTKLVITNL